MSDPRLSILCVTKAEPHAGEFLGATRELSQTLGAECVIVPDGPLAAGRLHDQGLRAAPFVISQGFIESVLDEALTLCSGDYVLRLDDDERCSPAMVKWLASREYEKAAHWKFPRANLWSRFETFCSREDWLVLTPHLWPDEQTRLSVKVIAGGRRGIHSGSPHGGGETAPVMLLHEKFLVKHIEERRAIVRRYDLVQPGAGTNFLPWSVPEDFYEKVLLAPVGDGTVREWADDELRSVSLRMPREVAA